jgi:hypothetical protein
MLPVEMRPGSDCNGLVTGRRPIILLVRQLSGLLSDRTHHPLPPVGPPPTSDRSRKSRRNALSEASSEFGESSVDVDVFAYVATADWNEFLAVQEDVVLRIMDIVRAAGTAFALPSRTLYHGRDRGLDPERQEAAGK